MEPGLRAATSSVDKAAGRHSARGGARRCPTDPAVAQITVAVATGSVGATAAAARVGAITRGESNALSAGDELRHEEGKGSREADGPEKQHALDKPRMAR